MTPDRAVKLTIILVFALSLAPVLVNAIDMHYHNIYTKVFAPR